jgi:hypothetical protein
VAEARERPAFKVLNDGSLYASAVDISGTIHATQGGQIGPFALTSNGLDSGYIKLDAKQAYFPVQTELNLNDSVKLFCDLSKNTSYITTVNSQDFVIQNFSGAGIKFNRDSEYTEQEISMIISGPNCDVKGPTGAYASVLIDKYPSPVFQYTAQLTAKLPFSVNKDVVIRHGVVDGGLKFVDTVFTVHFDAFQQTVTGEVALEKGTSGTYYNPLSQDSYYKDKTGIFFYGDEFTCTNDISYIVHSYSGDNNVLYSLGNFSPITNNLSLGSEGKAWGNLHLSVGDQVNSDIRLKNTIEALPENYEVFFDGLKPVSYILNDGQSGRKHIGFIAQDVEQSLNSADIDTKDFAGLCIPKEDGLYYALRYEEFIALNTHMIQKLKKENAALKEANEALEARLAAIEEKLSSL